MQWPEKDLMLMADGASNPEERTWGVGICAPQKELEVYMGGKMDDITLPGDPRSFQKRLSVEVAEVLALWFAVRFACQLVENRDLSASPDKCNITVVTDRPASMVSLQHNMLGCHKAYKCEEFKAILHHLSHSLAKLCKAGGEVTVRWKGDVEHLQHITPKRWQPDGLARLGMQERRVALPLEWYSLCPEIAIQMTHHPLDRSLMTKAIVSLKESMLHGHPLHLQLSHEAAIAAAGLPDDRGTGTSRAANEDDEHWRCSTLTVEVVMP